MARKHLLTLGALLLALVLWRVCRGGARTARLAVGLVAVETNPGAHPPKMSLVLNGNTGLCAVFAVTNVGKDASVWFETSALEQKVGEQWQRTLLAPYRSRVVAVMSAGRKPWFTLDSKDANDAYSPGTAWSYAVAWPARVPTNGTWRLQLRYGRAPSAFTRKMSDLFGFTGKLGATLFNQRRVEGTLLTPEVRQ